MMITFRIVLLNALLFSLNIALGQTSPYDIVLKPKLEVKTEDTSTKEFLKNFPFLNPLDWTPGMKFMAAPLRDKTFENISSIGLSPYGSKNQYLSQIKQSEFQWKVFEYKYYEQRNINCPKGFCHKIYFIFDCEGKKYEYEYSGDTTQLRKDDGIFSFKISNLAYLGDVDKSKELLVGKTFFIMSQKWKVDDKDGIGRYTFDNPKFFPVTVIDVGLGTSDYPVKIVFKKDNDDDQFYLNVSISRINTDKYMDLYDFEKYFQLENPKLKYPEIDSAVWELIQKGQVRIGMSRKECELSWGKPKKINNSMSAGEISEQWVYSTSSYLYFKNGVLDFIQN